MLLSRCKWHINKVSNIKITGVPVATAFQKGSIILDLMIINFENAASHEYVVQNAKSL